ncbi:hypothetical protein [Steroidobacter cummioxidans]|uniref:hypothetical protein n=1 Tax=Steroidobacter cummioxidans TaxID=1803913 RepID=UPI00129036C4|nr:hypothetical protein [Steroidobacter cummioxidans]
MLRSIQPLHFLPTLLAGWINRQQTEVIEYLKEENRLLKERLGGRLQFTDFEHRRLARRAHALGRRALGELDTLVTPDTLMRWYRTLVAQKWTYTHRPGPGRPRTIQLIAQLIVRMALENRSWGYSRIQGALANLGHDVGAGRSRMYWADHGIDPAPERERHTSSPLPAEKIKASDSQKIQAGRWRESDATVTDNAPWPQILFLDRRRADSK